MKKAKVVELTMKYDENRERELFQTSLSKFKSFNRSFTRNVKTSKYVDDEIEMCWLIWQARAMLAVIDVNAERAAWLEWVKTK